MTSLDLTPEDIARFDEEYGPTALKRFDDRLNESAYYKDLRNKPVGWLAYGGVLLHDAVKGAVTELAGGVEGALNLMSEVPGLGSGQKVRLNLAHPEDEFDSQRRSVEEIERAREHSEWERQITGEGTGAKLGRSVARTAGEVAGFLFGTGGGVASGATNAVRGLMKGVGPQSIASLARSAERLGISSAQAAQLASNGTLLTEVFARAAAKSPKAKALLQRATSKLGPEMVAQSVGMGTAFAVTEHRGEDRLERLGAGAVMGIFGAAMNEVGLAVQHALTKGPKGAQTIAEIEAWLAGKPGMSDRVASAVGEAVAGTGFSPYDIYVYSDALRAAINHGVDSDEFIDKLGVVLGSPAAFGVKGFVRPSRKVLEERMMYGSARQAYEARLAGEIRKPTTLEPTQGPVQDGDLRGISAMEAAGWTRTDASGGAEFRLPGSAADSPAATYDGQRLTLPKALYREQFSRTVGEDAPDTVTFEGEAAAIAMQLLAMKANANSARGRALFEGMEPTETPGVYWDPVSEAKFSFEGEQVIRRNADGSSQTFSADQFLVGRRRAPDRLLAPTFKVAQQTMAGLLEGAVRVEGAIAGGLVKEVAASLRDSLLVLERGDVNDPNTIELARLVESPEFAAVAAQVTTLPELATFANEFAAVAAGRATAEDAIGYASRAMAQDAAAGDAVMAPTAGEARPDAAPVDPAREVEPVVEPTRDEVNARTKETQTELDAVVHDLNVLRADQTQDRRQEITRLEETYRKLREQLETEADEVRRQKVETAPRIEDKIPPAEVTREQEVQQLLRDLRVIVERKPWTTEEGKPNDRVPREQRETAAAEFLQKAMAGGKEIDPSGLARVFGLGQRRATDLFQQAKAGRQKRIDVGVRMERELAQRRSKAADVAAARHPDQPGRPMQAELADVVGEVAANVHQKGGGITRFARELVAAVRAKETGPIVEQREPLLKRLAQPETTRALWDAVRTGRGAFQRVERILQDVGMAADAVREVDAAMAKAEQSKPKAGEASEEPTVGRPSADRPIDRLAEAIRGSADIPEKGRARLADSVVKLASWVNGQAKKAGVAGFAFIGSGDTATDLLTIGGAAAALLVGRKVISKSAAQAALRALKASVNLGRKLWGIGVRDPAHRLMGRAGRLIGILEPLASRLTEPAARATWDRLLPKLVGYVSRAANALAFRDWGVASKAVRMMADSLTPYAADLQEATAARQSRQEKAKLAGSKLQAALVKAFGNTPEQRIKEGSPKHSFFRAVEEGRRPTEAGPVQEAYDLWAEQRRLAADMLVEEGLLEPERVIKNYYPHLYQGRLGAGDYRRIMAEAVAKDPSKVTPAVEEAMNLQSLEVAAKPIGSALRGMESGSARLKARKRKEANVEEYLLDPLVALPRTIIAELSLVANKRLLNDIARSDELSVGSAEEAAERWGPNRVLKVTDKVATKRMLGDLKGRYVHPHTLAEIEMVGGARKKAIDAIPVVWSMMKQALTITKPSFAMMQDFTQGMVMAAAGVDASIWNERAKVQARKGIEAQDQYFRELLDAGETGTELIAVEQPEVARVLEKWADDGSNSLVYEFFARIQDYLNQGRLARPAQFVKRISTESDSLARYVMYRHLRQDRKLSKDKALARVRATYNYRSLVPLAHTIGGLIPFQRFAFKMMEALGKYGLRERPISAVFIGMVPFLAARMLMSALAGENDEDKVRAGLLSGGGWASGLSLAYMIPMGRDAEGNMQYFDASRFMVHEPVLLWLQGRETPYRSITPTTFEGHPLVQLAKGLISGENRQGRVYQPDDSTAGKVALSIAYTAQAILPEITGVPAMAEVIRAHGPGGPEGSAKRLGRQVTRQFLPGLVLDEQRVGGIIRSQARGEELAQESAVREPRRRVMSAAMDELRDAQPADYGRIIGGIRERLNAEKLPPLDRGELGTLLSAARSKSAIARGLYGQAFSVQIATLRRLLDRGELNKRDREAALQIIRPSAQKVREAAATLAAQLGIEPIEASRIILETVRELGR